MVSIHRPSGYEPDTRSAAPLRYKTSRRLVSAMQTKVNKSLIAVCDQSFQSTNAPALPTAGSVGFEPTHSDYIVGCSPFELLPV